MSDPLEQIYLKYHVDSLSDMLTDVRERIVHLRTLDEEPKDSSTTPRSVKLLRSYEDLERLLIRTIKQSLKLRAEDFNE